LDPLAERPEPAQALLVRDGRVRGRGGRQHVEPRRTERAELRAELGPLPEEAAVGLLADERDRTRMELGRHALDALGVEVAAAQVARAGCRAIRGVRRAVAESEQLELLARVELPRREPRVV